MKSVKIPQELHKRVKLQAVEKNIAFGKYVQQLLNYALDDQVKHE